MIPLWMRQMWQGLADIALIQKLALADSSNACRHVGAGVAQQRCAALAHLKTRHPAGQPESPRSVLPQFSIQSKEQRTRSGARFVVVSTVQDLKRTRHV